MTNWKKIPVCFYNGENTSAVGKMLKTRGEGSANLRVRKSGVKFMRGLYKVNDRAVTWKNCLF